MNLSYHMRATYWLSLFIQTLEQRRFINAQRDRYQTFTAFHAPGRN